MQMSIESLETMLRPLRVTLESALESLLGDPSLQGTRPMPRMTSEPDGSGRLWVEDEFDPGSLVRAAMPQLHARGQLRIAEMLLARELGIDPGALDDWTPQRAIIEVFLEDFLREAISAPDDSPFDDPADIAFGRQTARLHALLTTGEFAGQLIVPIGGVKLEPDEIRLAPHLTLTPFSQDMRDQLWRIAGWGSIAPQPLQAHELRDVSHAILLDLHGTLLAPWQWPDAYQNAGRACRALLLAGAASARQTLAWLRHDERFTSYLTRLRVGSGVVVQPRIWTHPAPSTLNPSATSQLPGLYAALKKPIDDPALDLALRRLFSASERASDEDRLIDSWIAFEALFASDAQTELSFRASLRIARYIGNSRPERERLRAALKKAYDWRSRLVHGGDPSTAKVAKIGTLHEAVTVCDRALRAALARAVLDGSAPDLEKLDDTFLA
jgi:hypothetical protein